MTIILAIWMVCKGIAKKPEKEGKIKGVSRKERKDLNLCPTPSVSGGKTVTPVGLVSASFFRGSMSKKTWEGSPRPRHTLPRCTLHLSRTSAVTTEGLQALVEQLAGLGIQFVPKTTTLKRVSKEPGRTGLN